VVVSNGGEVMIALVKEGTAFEASSIVDLIFCTGWFRFDYEKGQLFFNEHLDTITYSKNYTPKEMAREMAERAVKLLKQRGWTLYKAL
jgi:hypothetical protein